MSTPTLPMPSSLGRLQQDGLALGAVFLLALAVGFFLDRDQFFRSYLFGWLFWLGIAVGCLGLAMLNQLTGGLWGLVPRRFHEAAARTLPAMAVLFLPVLLGLSSLYVWARPEVVAADEIIQTKTPYLNVPFFVARAVFYFAVWSGLALLVSRWSTQQDAGVDPARAGRLRGVSGVGLVAPVRDHDLRRHRLGHVAGPPLVLHDVRRPVHRGLDAVRSLLHHRPDVPPLPGVADERGPAARDGPRPGQAAPRLHHALGLRELLPVPHRVVGQHQRGDAVLHPAPARGLGRDRGRAPRRSTSPCPSPCCSPGPSSATRGASRWWPG